MTDFYSGLKDYYEQAAHRISAAGRSAAIYSNRPDMGMQKEIAYMEFLQDNLPKSCDIFLGGFLFDREGNQSKQIDIIVTNGNIPRFRILGEKGIKAFAPVEGTIGVFSIKSKLDKKQLFDCLDNFASIPETEPLADRIDSLYSINNYENWPFKAVFGFEAINIDLLLRHIENYYANNKNIPKARRPNLIHILGENYIILNEKDSKYRRSDGVSELINEGKFVPLSKDPDVFGLARVIYEMHTRAQASKLIFYKYSDILNHLYGFQDR